MTYAWDFILGIEAEFNEFTFVDARDFQVPGGPNYFVLSQHGHFINIFGTSAYVMLNWFADALVVSRADAARNGMVMLAAPAFFRIFSFILFYLILLSNLIYYHLSYFSPL